MADATRRSACDQAGYARWQERQTPSNCLEYLEAGTGIEPVFTDLQSNKFSRDINGLRRKKYQDILATIAEHDTPQIPRTNGRKKKNPDALAGAIGADHKKLASGKIGVFRWIEYRIRFNRAILLCEAIRKTHPDDARQLLIAALADLGADAPAPSRQERVREDANWWAAMATPLELMGRCLATLSKLTGGAL